MSIIRAGSLESRRTLKRARRSTRKLPDEIVFLRDDLPFHLLEQGAIRARELGVGADEILIAEGWITEADYYARLAISVDADFVGDPCNLDVGADWRAALRTGVIRLADGRWLAAPRGAGVSALAARVTERASTRLALATPKDFERAVMAQFAPEIAEEGANLLPRTRPELSARSGASASQKALALALCALLAAELAFGLQAWLAAQLLVGMIMCVAVLVRILATGLSLAPARAVQPLQDGALPSYSVLVALYDEAAVAAKLVAAMLALDYPAARHEVIFIVEADDVATRAALEAQALPAHFRIIVAPQGAPRTKPRALNIGLLVARGERLVIYDAEDRPEPDQLRKAAARFHAGSPKLAALQAQLKIENRADTWLTQLFALDYAAQFDVLLPGMARLGVPLPLGGTSNHFTTQILRDVGGWDAWNVTEDADLGLRLARMGYRCGTLRSVTFEEAPPTLRDWFPQRRRWLKGWMQTLLTHTRHPLRLFLDLGPVRAMHALALLASNTLGPAIGLWITLYVLHESLAGDFLDVQDGAWRSLVWMWTGLAGFGVISIILPTAVAIVRAKLWTGAPWLALRPLHWLCVSAAFFHAVYELWACPHHWPKTRHGLARRKDAA